MEPRWLSRGKALSKLVYSGEMGMRGGAAGQTNSTSAGVRGQAWVTRLLNVRSGFKASLARARLLVGPS